MKISNIVGAVHIEKGHPHLQIMIWDKSKEKRNYFVKYGKVNKMLNEFSNEVFKEDLLLLYKEKDIAKKGILEKNYILQNLKKVSDNPKFIKEMLKYEQDFYDKKIMKRNLKNKQLKLIADDLVEIKELLKQTKGSIKYQFLMKYPEVIQKVDNLSKRIIGMSLDCKEEIDRYILARQNIVTFKYSNQEKIEQAQNEEKEKAQKEIIKLIGNQILNFERVLLNEKIEYSQIGYSNKSRDLVWKIFNVLYCMSKQEEKYLKQFEIKYKKHLSKQAKKDKAINKANGSSFDWEEDI